MKSLISVVAVLGAVSAAAPVQAQSELAQKKNCLACHAVDKKIVGPAFKDVATKFAGRPDATEVLSGRILKGSSGIWGPVPMPANTQVTEAEANQLAAWVMSLK